MWPMRGARKGRDLLHRFVEGRAGEDHGCVCVRQPRIGRNPSQCGPSPASTIHQSRNLSGGDDHFLVDTFECLALTAIQRCEKSGRDGASKKAATYGAEAVPLGGEGLRVVETAAMGRGIGPRSRAFNLWPRPTRTTGE